MEFKNIKDTIKIYETYSFNENDLIKLYWYNHPHYQYIKTIYRNSSLLDIGAGSGGLIHWKAWEFPLRNDIIMYAIDYKKGEYFDLYNKYQILNFEQDEINLGNIKFNNLYMCHVIEHLINPTQFIKKMNHLVDNKTFIYIEWPSKNSLSLPTKKQFKENGINLTISNFFDDSTHEKTYSLREVNKLMEENNYEVVSQGVIVNEFAADLLLGYGLKYENEFYTTIGYWLKTGWSNFLIAKKI